MKRSICALVAGLALLAAPTPALALPPPDRGAGFGMKFVDVVLVRPFTMVGSLAGSGLFLATLPLTFFTGVANGAAEYVMVAPWRFTTARFPGEFDRYKDGRNVLGHQRSFPRDVPAYVWAQTRR